MRLTVLLCLLAALVPAAQGPVRPALASQGINSRAAELPVASVGGPRAPGDESWSAVPPLFDASESVLALLPSGSDLYVAGRFTSTAGVSLNNIGKWSPSGWSVLGSGINGPVNALMMIGSDLYAGGDFTQAGTVAARNIARWDGTRWSPLGAGLNGPVTALALLGGNLYAVGGSFQVNSLGLSQNGIARWNGSTWSSLGDGPPLPYSSLDSEGREHAFRMLTSLAVVQDKVYVGGYSCRSEILCPATTAYDDYLAVWNSSTWRLIPLPADVAPSVPALPESRIATSVPSRYIDALATRDSLLYISRTIQYLNLAGGDYTQVDRWDGTNWSSVTTRTGGRARTLLPLDGEIYVGGSRAGGVARWDGNAWATPGSGVNGPVAVLALVGQSLLVGGSFTQAGGKPAPRLARWSGVATSPGGQVNRPGNLHLMNPVRIVDTRPTEPGPGIFTIGYGPDGSAIAPGVLAPGQIRRFAVGGKTFNSRTSSFTFPINTTGLLINVTIQQDGPSGGYLTVFGGDLSDAPKASTVNPATRIAHNFWATGVPVSGPFAGTIGIYTTNALHVIIDVVGYYMPDASATVGPLRFITPTRVVDTRPTEIGPGILTIGYDAVTGQQINPGPIPAGTTRRFQLAGKTFKSGGGDFTFPLGTSGILFHITIQSKTGIGGGFATLFPGNIADFHRPNASTVNPSTAIAFNSGVIGIPIDDADAGSFAVYSTNDLDVIVDVMGFFAPSNPTDAGDLELITPTRVLDTRATELEAGIFTTGFDVTGQPIVAGTFNAGQTRRYQISGKSFAGRTLPADIKGILANVTIQSSSGLGGGFVTLFPGGLSDINRPNASTVNPSTAIAASFWANGITTSGDGAGTLAVFSTNPLHVVVDIVGYFR